METYLASQGRGRPEADDDYDDDDDYDEDEADDQYDGNYEWGDDDTRYGNAQHFGEEDYYTDDDEGDIERGPPAPRQKTWGQRVAHVAATGDVFDEIGDDEKADWGFWLAGLFKGTSTGRRLKRLFLNFCLWQLACGVPLFILAVLEDVLYGYVGNWFTNVKYGSRCVPTV
jgi:hypothetical protein